ncbi:MAG: TIGR04282 family arsenosugar biosynthesis glycosyltransferase [Anaerolineae bacterium]|nr:TIGR04282 family arsenosugar biosynthesis glycosyltransferase [Phycisphaerae bacterium]
MHRVTLYSKPDCHLCDDAKLVIERVRARHALELVVRDIRDNAKDFANYQFAIPVITVNDREIARHRLDEAQLEAALASQIQIVLMAKFPQAGKVKTRLSPTLSPAQAAKTHEAFLKHLGARLAKMNLGEIVICFDPPEAAAAMRDLMNDVSRTFVPQVAGDLTARLCGFGNASSTTLFLGGDSPDLPERFVRRTVDLLHENDLVIGPTDDGGYWCLGLDSRVNRPELLRGIEWSSGREFDQTLERARSLGYNVGLADQWDDVDRPEDLTRLLDRLQKSTDTSDRELLTRLKFLPAGVWP